MQLTTITDNAIADAIQSSGGSELAAIEQICATVNLREPFANRDRLVCNMSEADALKTVLVCWTGFAEAAGVLHITRPMAIQAAAIVDKMNACPIEAIPAFFKACFDAKYTDKHNQTVKNGWPFVLVLDWLDQFIDEHEQAAAAACYTEPKGEIVLPKDKGEAKKLAEIWSNSKGSSLIGGYYPRPHWSDESRWPSVQDWAEGVLGYIPDVELLMRMEQWSYPFISAVISAIPVDVLQKFGNGDCDRFEVGHQLQTSKLLGDLPRPLYMLDMLYKFGLKKRPENMYDFFCKVEKEEKAKARSRKRQNWAFEDKATWNERQKTEPKPIKPIQQ